MFPAFVLLTALAGSFPPLKALEYDPEVAEIIDNVSEDSISAVVAGLSGEVPVLIEGLPDSLACRHAYSPGSYRAALWLRQELDGRGASTELCSFVPLEFTDVALLDSGEGFACARNGLAPNNLFHTGDAGATWQPEGKLHLLWEDLELLETGACYALSSAGRLARNLDGFTWELLSVPKGLYSLSFTDSLHGWAAGDSGMIVATSDAGESWSEEQIAADNLRRVDFVSLSTGWTASREGLWTTADGGQSWSYLSHPLKEISALRFTDSLTGWLAGVTGQAQGGVYLTRDGGVHWEELVDTLRYIPRAIDVVSPETLWVAGGGGMILASFDAGAHWERKPSSTQASLAAIDFAAGRGIALGPEEIIHSPDGESWMRPDTTNLGLMWNVVGTIPGTDSTQVILTAHYDARSEDAFYTPGADDNASGVACVLEAARVLSTHPFRHTLRFLCFAGEEVGFLGSHRYVNQSLGAGEDILAVLNADMIAYDSNSDRRVEVNANEEDPRSPAAAKLVLEVIDLYGLGLEPRTYVKDAKQNSDHYYFWQNMIPAVFLHEDRDDFNPFYHQTEDRLQELDLGYFTENVRAAVAWAAVMADADTLVDCQEKAHLPEEALSLRLASTIVTGRVSLEVKAPYPVTPIIFDAAGRKVRCLSTITSSSEQTGMVADVSDLPSGVYWVSVTGTHGVVSERFIIVR